MQLTREAVSLSNPSGHSFAYYRIAFITIGMTCLSLSLSACSLFSSEPEPEPEPKIEEITDTSKPGLDTPERELMDSAKRYFRNGMFTVARDQFEAIRDGYPTGAYAEFSQIKIADTYFENNDFEAAAGMYEQLLKDRPSSEAIPYLILRTARSYHMANRGVGRDTSPLQKAIEFYDRLLRDYPNSTYSEGAKAWKQDAQERLAAYDKLVLEFYQKQNKQAAFEARKREFANRWGKDSQQFDYADQQPDPRETVALVPDGKPYPQNKSQENLRALNKESKEQPIAITRHTATQTGSLMVRLVECDRDNHLLLLHLNKPITDRNFLKNNSHIKIENGAVQFTVPALRTPGSESIRRDCFTPKDLEVTNEGRVSLVTVGQSIELLELENPPRLAIMVE